MSILKFIWQLPQNLLGLAVILVTDAYQASDTHWIGRSFGRWGVSLGNYVIFGSHIPRAIDIKHEQGHQKQSLILGPLYLIVIGLPSACGNIIQRITKGDWYYKQPWEAWADKLGGVVRRC